MQDPGKLALDITERSREHSPLSDFDWEGSLLADVDWGQFNFRPGFRVTHTSDLRKLLSEFQHTLLITPEELECTGLTYHSIRTGSSAPVLQQPRRIVPKKRKSISSQINEMLSEGIVPSSCGPWSHSVPKDTMICLV